MDGKLICQTVGVALTMVPATEQGNRVALGGDENDSV
jgi:hypothetical protein